MAVSKYTQRMHALEFAIASSSPEDEPQDIVRRAQIYGDWLTGVYTVPLEYQVSAAHEEHDAQNVLPMKPKKG
jgi:hypothetical protein